MNHNAEARAEQAERLNLVLRRNTGYLTEATELRHFLGQLLKETLELLDADGGHIFIYHRIDESFSYAAGGTIEDIHLSPAADEPSFFQGRFPASTFPVFEKLRAVRHAAILSRDGKDAPPPREMMKWFQERGFIDAVCLVLTAGEMPVGFIGAVFRKQPDLSPQMMDIFHALANQGALAIHLSTLAEAAKEIALSKERELAAKSKTAELEKEIQARRDSEYKLRQIVETIPALLWSTDSAGEPTYISQGLMEYCGQRGLEDVRHGRWETFVHPDDLPETVKSFNHSLQTGASHQVLQRLRRADGEFRWHYTRAEPMRDQQGRIIQWYGLSLDIHEGKQAQDELRDVLDSIPSVVWSAFPDGSNAYVNRRWVKYSGRPAEAMAGLGWQTAIHPDDLERHYATWLACIASGEPSDDEARYLRADGKYRWHLRRATPIRDEKGNVVKWYGVLTDIEDRKTIEEALRSSEAYLAEAQRLSRTGSFGWNVATGELVWSDETFCILGYDRNIKPTLELCFDRVHPEEKAFVKQTLDRAISEASSLDFEHRLLMPDGAVKHVHVLAKPTKTDTGRLEFIGAVMDITERKKSATALRASEHLARGQLDALVDTLAVLAREPKPLKFLEHVYSIICEQLGAVGLGTWEVAGDAGGIKRIANYEGRRLHMPTGPRRQVQH
jgi:PAS domain S-box-containing protein